MESNYIRKKTLKGKEQNSTLSSAETSLSHDLECSHLLCSVTNSHSSQTRRSSSSSTLTLLLLPSLSSVTGPFCHSSSHSVNRCDTFRSRQCISHRTSAQSQAAPPAQSSPCPQEHWAWLGILTYLYAWPY